MKKCSYIKVVLCIVSMVVMVVSCEKKYVLKGSIKIVGSSMMLPISKKVADTFITLHKGIDISIHATGTQNGFQQFFITGKADINNADRPIKSSEKKSSEDNGIIPLEFHVATDAITIVVSKENPISNILIEELASIWSPHIATNNWSQINPNWPNLPFELYGPTNSSSTFNYFTDVINGEQGLSRIDYQKTEDTNTIINAIKESNNAIGYLKLIYYSDYSEYSENIGVKALHINGVVPSVETARNGEYTPLSRQLYIYVSSHAFARKEIQEFMRFYLEATSTSLISEVGYIPVTRSTAQANLKKLEEIIEKYQE